ncbi:hypothetical protein ACEPAF_5704 [Sanghuangporus sanghuang]
MRRDKFENEKLTRVRTYSEESNLTSLPTSINVFEIYMMVSANERTYSSLSFPAQPNDAQFGQAYNHHDQAFKDAFTEFASVLGDCPMIETEHMSSSYSSNIDINPREFFGDTTENSEGSRSNSMVSASMLSVEEYDRAFSCPTQTSNQAGSGSHAATWDSSSSDLRESVLHSNASDEPTWTRSQIVSTIATRLSVTIESSRAFNEVHNNRVDPAVQRTLNVPNTYVDLSSGFNLSSSEPRHIPISRSVRARFGSSTLPVVSPRSGLSHYRAADLQAQPHQWPDLSVALRSSMQPGIPVPQDTERTQRHARASIYSTSNFGPTDPPSASVEPMLDPSPFQTPSWAAWIEYDQEPLSSPSYPSISPAGTSLTRSDGPIDMTHRYTASSSRGRTQLPVVRRSRDLPRDTAISQCAPSLQSMSTEGSCGTLSCGALLVNRSHEPSVDAPCLNTDTKVTILARSEKRKLDGRNSKITLAPGAAVSVREPASGETHKSVRPRVPYVKGKQAESPHHEIVPENAQTFAFVSDRLGDIGLCKFTVKDDNGAFRRVCNAKILDNADAARDHLARHFREHGLYALGLTKKVWCPWCKLNKTQFNGFSRHIIDVHLKINLMHCPCGGSNSRGQQFHNVKRHLDCDTHLLWVSGVEKQLEEIIGEVHVSRDEDFFEYEKQGRSEFIEGSSSGTRRRRRYTV